MKDVIIIIPVYKNFLEEYEKKSLIVNLLNLELYNVLVIAPHKLKFDNKFNEILFTYKLGVVYFDDYFFKDIDGYNKLMLDFKFYKCFEDFNYMLICQLDALVLSNKLDVWVSKGFDYVGAPFICEDGDNYFFNSMGNGGLSLRNIPKFLNVLNSECFYFSSYKYFSISIRGGLKNIFIIKLLHRLDRARIKIKFAKVFLFFFKLNEDYFWAFFSKFFVKDFCLPTVDEALLFSFDVNPRKCYAISNNQLPFGCHAWQKYDRNFWEEVCPFLKD